MLFMVIEHFTSGPGPVRDRFVREGRLLPEGVQYLASWVDPQADRCFQLMQAESAGKLQEWTARWKDLIDFNIVPVLTSEEYWKTQS